MLKKNALNTAKASRCIKKENVIALRPTTSCNSRSVLNRLLLGLLAVVVLGGSSNTLSAQCSTFSISYNVPVTATMTNACFTTGATPGGPPAGASLREYQFDGEAGDNIEILMSSTAFDTFLLLVAPNGSVLAQDDDGAGSLNSRIPSAAPARFVLPSAGVYRVLAMTRQAGRGGAFQLRVDHPACLTTAGSGAMSPVDIFGPGLAIPVTTGGQMTTACGIGDRDALNTLVPNGSPVRRYLFRGNAGQRIFVQMSAAFDSFIDVLDDSDTLRLGRDDNSGGGTNARVPSSGFVTLPATGGYFVSAVSKNGGLGRFTLEIGTGPNCPYSFSFNPATTPAQWPPAGGSVSILLQTESGCPWTASSNAPWLTVGTARGTGQGQVSFTASPNLTAATRTGTVVIAGITVNVQQPTSAPVCTFTFSPLSPLTAPSSASNQTIQVTAPSGCVSWSATSNSAFITVTSTNLTGTAGNGTVVIAVQANPSSSPRTGTLTIGNLTYTITQSGAPCIFTVDPTTTITWPAAGSTAAGNFVSVTTPTGCVWSATSNVTWVTFTGIVNGSGQTIPPPVSGPGFARFTIAANLDPLPRSGTATVAGQTVTFNQSGTATGLTLAPTAINVAAIPGSTNPVTQQLAVSAGGALSAFSTVVGTASGGNWLSISPTGGTTPANLTVTANPSGLAAGVYSGSITVTAPGVPNSPRTVAVTFTISSTPVAGRQLLSQIADGAGWKTTIILVNLDTQPAPFTLKFYTGTGLALRLPIEGSVGRLESLEGIIPVGGSRTIQTASTDAALSQGWAELSSPSRISGLGVFRQRAEGRPDQEAGVSATVPATRFVLPFDNTQGFVSSMALVNTNANESRATTVTPRDEAGTALPGTAINLPPLGHNAFAMSEQFSSVTGRRGAAEFSSTAPDFSALGLRFNPSGAFTSLPALPITSAAIIPTQVISQVADGSGWKTSITLVNLDTVPAPFTLRFWHQNGSALPVPILGGTASETVEGTIPVGGTRIVETQATATDLIQGWAELSTTRAISGLAVFRQRATGRPDQEAAVSLTATGNRFVVPFDNTENFVTSMALVNSSATLGTTISVVLRDENGVQIGTDSINLGGRGHTAFALTDRFTASRVRRGTAEFTSSNAQITGLGLRFNPGGAFTSFPVLPLN